MKLPTRKEQSRKQAKAFAKAFIGNDLKAFLAMAPSSLKLPLFPVNKQLSARLPEH